MESIIDDIFKRYANTLAALAKEYQVTETPLTVLAIIQDLVKQDPDPIEDLGILLQVASVLQERSEVVKHIRRIDPLQLAVIEAAKAWYSAPDDDDNALIQLAKAIEALQSGSNDPTGLARK